MERAKQSPAAAFRDGSRSGSLTRSRTYEGRAPSPAAACSYIGSRRRIAAATDWWAKAVTSTVWARTTIQRVPLRSTGGCEKATRTARPTTTDGTATGSMKRASTIRRPRFPRAAEASAAQVPAVSAIRLAVTAVTRLVVRARRDSPRTAAA